MLRIRESRLVGDGGRLIYLRRGCMLRENAIRLCESVDVRILLPRRVAAVGADLMLSVGDGEPARIPMRYVGLFDGCDAYEVRITPQFSEVHFLYAEIRSPFGNFYGGKKGYFGRMGFCRESKVARFQLTVSHFEYPPPAWIYGGIIYHIFVDRFRRGGQQTVRDDIVLNPDWENGVPAYPGYPGGPLENNEFFGGTLDGITEKLDDLATLGVNCLYLSPIFEAYSNHKYDTGNYEKIDEMFGGQEALLRLIAAAGRRGMRIVLDGVFNHTGADSVYFNKKGRYPTLGAYQSKESPYFSWYHFYKHPVSYESWWGIDTLPRLDTKAPQVYRYLLGEGGIVDRYAALGLGGFRLDVVDELPDEFVAGIKSRLAARVPDAVLYGEVWEDASCKVSYGVRRRYYTGSLLDGVMNYPLRTGLLEYFTVGRTERLRYALCEVLPNMPKRIADATMNLLGTHDTERIITALGGRPAAGQTMDERAFAKMTEEEYAVARSRLILAYLALATLPGVPSIYYGDEVGLEGYSDPLNRRPYPWHRRDCILLSAYSHIGRMRRRERIFRRGVFCLLHLSSELFMYTRNGARRSVLVVINRSRTPLRLAVDGAYRVLYGQGDGGGEYCIEGRSGAVLSVCRGISVSAFIDNLPVVFEKL